MRFILHSFIYGVWSSQWFTTLCRCEIHSVNKVQSIYHSQILNGFAVHCEELLSESCDRVTRLQQNPTTLSSGSRVYRKLLAGWKALLNMAKMCWLSWGGFSDVSIQRYITTVSWKHFTITRQQEWRTRSCEQFTDQWKSTTPFNWNADQPQYFVKMYFIL